MCSTALRLSRISIERAQLLADDLAHALPGYTEMLSEPRLQPPSPTTPGNPMPDEDARCDAKFLGPRELLCRFLLHPVWHPALPVNARSRATADVARSFAGRMIGLRL